MRRVLYRSVAPAVVLAMAMALALAACTVGEPPAAPTGAATSSPTNTSLAVSWNGVTGARTYQVFRDTSPGGTFADEVYDGSALSFTDTGLTTWRAYYYRVRASNEAGPGALSATAAGTACTGQKLYWPFNGGAIDAGGGGLDGVVSGAVLCPDRSSAVDEAYSFDGTGAAIDQATSHFSTTGVLSVSFWILIPTSASWCPVLLSDDFEVWANDGVNSVGLMINTAAGATSASVTITRGQWTHIVGTYDGTDIKIYWNGSLQMTTPQAGPFTSFTAGDFEAGHAAANYWLGDLDDVRIFDRVLDDAEITALAAFAG